MKQKIKTGDIVHLHAAQEFLEAAETDALSELGNSRIDEYMAILENKELQWKVIKINKCLAELKPVGFKCELHHMIHTKYLVLANQPKPGQYKFSDLVDALNIFHDAVNTMAAAAVMGNVTEETRELLHSTKLRVLQIANDAWYTPPISKQETPNNENTHLP